MTTPQPSDKSESQNRNSAATKQREAAHFPRWQFVLEASPLAAGVKAAHRMAILGFLSYCQEVGWPATVLRAKLYLDERARVPSHDREYVTAGLRWFFQQAAKQATSPSLPIESARASSANAATAISFPAWRQCLEASSLPGAVKNSHRWAIIGFLKHCKDLQQPASVLRVKAYLKQQANQARSMRG